MTLHLDYLQFSVMVPNLVQKEVSLMRSGDYTYL